MVYKVIGPDTEGRNFSDYMVVDEDEWAAYVSGKSDDYDFMGPFASLGEAEKVQDDLNRQEAEYQPNGHAEYFDLRDPGEDDGGYGEGSYYQHAMGKDD